VVFVADHGESLGEHDINFNHHGIYEEVLRVPLVVWTSDRRATPGSSVAQAVNVADIANTLMEYTGLPLLSGTGSVPLLSWVRGDELEPQPLLLRGRVGASLVEGQLCGVRSPNRIKYIRGQEGREEVYDLASDPGELQNIAEWQPIAVEAGRQNVAACLGQTIDSSGADAATRAQLEAMGYIDAP